MPGAPKRACVLALRRVGESNETRPAHGAPGDGQSARCRPTVVRHGAVELGGASQLDALVGAGVDDRGLVDDIQRPLHEQRKARGRGRGLARLDSRGRLSARGVAVFLALRLGDYDGRARASRRSRVACRGHDEVDASVTGALSLAAQVQVRRVELSVVDRRTIARRVVGLVRVDRDTPRGEAEAERSQIHAQAHVDEGMVRGPQLALRRGRRREGSAAQGLRTGRSRRHVGRGLRRCGGRGRRRRERCRTGERGDQQARDGAAEALSSSVTRRDSLHVRLPPPGLGEGHARRFC